MTGTTRRSVMGLVAAALAGRAAEEERTVQVIGCGAGVDIAWDRWGIPHIRAASVEDAFFGQGFAAASARLWQMDLGRRHGLGLLAEAFGPAFLPWDIAARTMLFQGDTAAEWRLHDKRVPSLAAAWVRGVNARIAQVLADPALLPPEFPAMDIRPAPWSPDDLILLRGSTTANAPAELRRALLAARGALALDALTEPLDPPLALRVPDGLDCAKLHQDQLVLYRRLSEPLPFPKREQHGEAGIDGEAGSNAWVVAAGHTTTGRAILANDPHLPVGIPGPRFICHLSAPGLNAIGAGPASRPGFQFGHTDRIAFGRTDFRIDREDIYVLELDAEGCSYRTAQGWSPIVRRTETIAVRGAADAAIEVARTPLGPVVFEDVAARHALVVRSALQESGPSVALEYVPLMFARNWAEYRRAISYAAWGSNYMYADIDGNIGWQASGRAPRRLRHDGLMPVPAAGDYPWDGFVGLDEMPGEYNPPQGWIASANQMPYSPGWTGPYSSREWTPDDRYRRIVQVLGPRETHSPAESLALQQDVLSLRAEALRPVWEAIGDPDTGPLQGWDGRLDANSEPALLFQLWWAELRKDVRLAMVPPEHRDMIAELHPHVLIALVTGADSRLGARRSEIAARTLARAAADWRARPEGRRHWGDLHRLTLLHGLSGVVPGSDLIAGGSGGDSATVQARWWASIPAAQVSGGASFRAVIDMGDWEAARGINLPGQSGDPRSPHYTDLAPLWLADETVPLAFGTEAVQSVQEETWKLRP